MFFKSVENSGRTLVLSPRVRRSVGYGADFKTVVAHYRGNRFDRGRLVFGTDIDGIRGRRRISTPHQAAGISGWRLAAPVPANSRPDYIRRCPYIYIYINAIAVRTSDGHSAFRTPPRTRIEPLPLPAPGGYTSALIR